uniref:NADH dehydrogenase subunit 6 n=1 Tax=Gergithus yunnanensis TaxID=1898278 RepID=UPI002E761385|nr:NADH dehydrogenase subunit 6 [Gergithus yunnanensis]WQB38540.1 NADH dehydrogenase subunit 6 [Gergithus yunnanensis]
MTKLMIINMMISPILKHPLSLGSMLIMQTTLMSIKMSKMNNSSWFSYILFITIIGGMMIMFMYMASIASNEKFSTKMNKKMLILMAMIIILPEFDMSTLEKKNEMKMIFMEMEEIKSTSKFFNKNKMALTIAIMLILLLTMISVTNVANTFEGPLKKK